MQDPVTDMAQKKYNIVWNLFYSSISTLTTFLLFLLMAFVGRNLGQKEYGVFVFALDFAAIFEMFTDFGLRDISVRNVSQNRSLMDKYIGNLIVWKTLLSGAVFVVLVAVVNAMGYDAQTRLTVYILAPSSFLKNMKYTVRIFFQVNDRFGWDTVLVALERILLLGVGLAVLFKWHSLIPFVAAFTLVRLADFLFTLAVLRWKIAPIRPQLDWSFMKRLQIDAFPLGLFFVIFTVYSYIDTVMLSKMAGMADVGQYNAAFKIYEGITIVPTIFWLVVLPRLSELYVNNRTAHGKLAVRSVKAMFVIGLPTLLCGIFFSKWLIGFFFKDAFLPAVLALQILFLGLLFQYPNWMLNAILISAGRQKAILALGTAGLAVKVLLNAVLIPIYGFNGSAVSTVIGESAIFMGLFAYIRSRVMDLPVLAAVVKPVVSGVGAVLGFWIFYRRSSASGLFFAAVFYSIGLLLTKTFEKHEWSALFSGILAKTRTP